MTRVKCTRSVCGKSAFKLPPYPVGDSRSCPHATQELYERIAFFEPLCSAQLEDMRNTPENFNRVLHFEAWGLWKLVVAILVFLVDILDKADVGRR